MPTPRRDDQSRVAHPPPGQARLVHFVGFRDDRWWNAARVFGPPDVIHRDWDIYAANGIAPWDLAVFADGEADRPPRSFSGEAARAQKERLSRPS